MCLSGLRFTVVLKSLQVLPFFLRSSIPLFRWKDFKKGPEGGLLELGCRKQNQGDNLLSWAQMMCMFGYVSRGGEERQKYQENVTLFQLSELRERGEGDEGGRERERVSFTKIWLDQFSGRY